MRGDLHGLMQLGARAWTIVYRGIISIGGEPNPNLGGSLDFKNGHLEIKDGICSQQDCETVCHEALHAIADSSGLTLEGRLLGDEDEEELLVESFTPWLHLFLVQNPGLILQVWQVAGIGPEEIERLLHEQDLADPREESQTR